MANHESAAANSEPSCHECTGNAAMIGHGICPYCALAGAALDAYWQVIVRQFPEAKCGDLSPERTIRLHVAASIKIEEWISNNAPVNQHGNAA